MDEKSDVERAFDHGYSEGYYRGVSDATTDRVDSSPPAPNNARLATAARAVEAFVVANGAIVVDNEAMVALREALRQQP